MKELLQIEKQQFNHIGTNTKIEGSLSFSGTTYISGKIKGDITITENATLIIERDGNFTGTINCCDIDVYGNIFGKINASGTLSVYPCAIITGEIKAKNINVKPGANINIECQTV